MFKCDEKEILIGLTLISIKRTVFMVRFYKLSMPATIDCTYIYTVTALFTSNEKYM